MVFQLNMLHELGTHLTRSIQLISRKVADLKAQIEDNSPEWHTNSYVPEWQMQHEGEQRWGASVEAETLW